MVFQAEELQKEKRKQLETAIEEKDAKPEAKDNEIADLRRLLGRYESIEETPPCIPKEREGADKSIMDV